MSTTRPISALSSNDANASVASVPCPMVRSVVMAPSHAGSVVRWMNEGLSALPSFSRQRAMSEPWDAASVGLVLACLSAGKTSRSDGCHTGLSPAASTLKP